MKKLDKHTINKFLEGNPRAFEKIFHSYYKQLFVFAKEYVIDYDISRDIVQEAFITLWEKREKLKANSDVFAFLCTVTRNNCLNYLKHNTVRQNFHTQRKVNSIHLLINLSSLRDDSSKFIEYQELIENIQIAVKQLPEKCRKVFELSRFQDMKNKEIAVHLDISEKTVENHITTAIKKINKELFEKYF